MTDILRRMNLMPLPVFEGEKEGAGGAGGDAGEGDKGGDAGGDKGGAGGDDKGGAGGDKAGEGAGGEGDKGGGQQDFDWRKEAAGDDAELLAELGRTKSLADLGKRLKDMRTKLSKGADAAEEAPGEDKPEELKAWREKRGIPLEPTGYKLSETVTTRLKDADKPIVEQYLAAQHKANATPAEVERSVAFYLDLQEAVAADREAADAANLESIKKSFRGQWGPDFKRNSELVDFALNKMIPGVDLTSARMSDGTLLRHVPEFVDFFLEQGIRLRGEGAYEESGGGGDAVETEIASLKAEMNADLVKWRQNPAKAKRLQTLYAQMETRQR